MALCINPPCGLVKFLLCAGGGESRFCIKSADPVTKHVAAMSFLIKTKDFQQLFVDELGWDDIC